MKQIELNKEFSLIVDYHTTVRWSIYYGNYNWQQEDVTDENFPEILKTYQEIPEKRAKLFNFNRRIGSDDVISEMNKGGYRPATLIELFAFGAAHPGLQRHCDIFALGSVWSKPNDHNYVPFLTSSNRTRGREIDISWYGNHWGKYDILLGIHM